MNEYEYIDYKSKYTKICIKIYFDYVDRIDVENISEQFMQECISIIANDYSWDILNRDEAYKTFMYYKDFFVLDESQNKAITIWNSFKDKDDYPIFDIEKPKKKKYIKKDAYEELMNLMTPQIEDGHYDLDQMRIEPAIDLGDTPEDIMTPLPNDILIPPNIDSELPPPLRTRTRTRSRNTYEVMPSRDGISNRVRTVASRTENPYIEAFNRYVDNGNMPSEQETGEEIPTYRFQVALDNYRNTVEQRTISDIPDISDTDIPEPEEVNQIPREQPYRPTSSRRR